MWLVASAAAVGAAAVAVAAAAAAAAAATWCGNGGNASCLCCRVVAFMRPLRKRLLLCILWWIGSSLCLRLSSLLELSLDSDDVLSVYWCGVSHQFVVGGVSL